jgi:hypothetical protein
MNNMLYGFKSIFEKFLLKFTLIPSNINIVDPVDAVDVVDPINPVDVADAIDAVDVVDPIDPVDVADAIDAVDVVDAVDAIDAINPILVQNTFTTKQQLIEEAKIPMNKSYSKWLPLQQYPRILQPVNNFCELTDLQQMETNDFFALWYGTDVLFNRSTNDSIRHNVMKGQAIQELVIRLKKMRARSKIGDIYAEVNASLKRNSVTNTGFVEIGARRMQELRSLGKAAEYLELDKYDYKCSLSELIRRAPQIVKEANSLKPVVEKRPALCCRAAPAAKKQRVE